MKLEDLYRTGLNFEDFIKTGEVDEVKDVEKYLDKTQVDGRLEEDILSIGKPIKILVLGEMWCPDCRINISGLEILSRINPNIGLKILLKDEREEFYEDYFSYYKEAGRLKIPTILVYDENFKELGFIRERPSLVKDFFKEGEEDLEGINKYKEGLYIGDLLEEVLDLLN